MAEIYCDRLGIPPPRLLDVALRDWPNYLDIMVFTLLARGGPLSMDELVGALSPLWTGSPGTLRTSLQKAWAGKEPIVKDAEDRLALDLESRHLQTILVRLGLRAPPDRPPGPPEPVVPPVDVALTREEFDVVFGSGVPPGLSGTRFAAAILDVFDRPMTPAEIWATLPPGLSG